MAVTKTDQLGGQERLLVHVIEQLTRPLLQISRTAELAIAEGTGDNTDWQLTASLAGSALQLAESYSLSLRLHANMAVLELEPLAVSALLYDAAQNLTRYARDRGVELELDMSPRLSPILGDRSVLASALQSLGQVFIDASAEADVNVVRLGAYSSRYGVVTGMYSTVQGLGTTSLRQARQLQGRVREPLQRFVSGPAAGVYVADSLFDTLATKLHVARHHKFTGLAATLAPSHQLAFV